MTRIKSGPARIGLSSVRFVVRLSGRIRGPAPHQPMPAEGIAPLPQPLGPAGPRADRRGGVQQPGPLLLARQPLELHPPRVVGQEERLLAVQHRRVRARRVIRALDRAGPQVELDAAQQGRVRVGVEVGIGQVRDLARGTWTTRAPRSTGRPAWRHPRRRVALPTAIRRSVGDSVTHRSETIRTPNGLRDTMGIEPRGQP